ATVRSRWTLSSTKRSDGGDKKTAQNVAVNGLSIYAGSSWYSWHLDIDRSEPNAQPWPDYRKAPTGAPSQSAKGPDCVHSVRLATRCHSHALYDCFGSD